MYETTIADRRKVSSIVIGVLKNDPILSEKNNFSHARKCL
jgi:hypothetical protein